MEMRTTIEKLLIFDCDGVLVDSEPLGNRIFVECLLHDGFDVDESYGKQFIGIALKDCLKKLEDDFDRTVSDGFVERLSLLTHEEMKRDLKPIPNIHLALDQLSNPKCVASGSDHARLKLSLEVTGLSSYFKHIYSATEVLHGKPFPDVFLLAAEKMNFSKENCIVIEDSFAGMSAGIAAGMDVYLYNPERHNDFEIPNEVVVFENMAQLPALIKANQLNGYDHSMQTAGR